MSDSRRVNVGSVWTLAYSFVLGTSESYVVTRVTEAGVHGLCLRRAEERLMAYHASQIELGDARWTKVCE